MMQIYLTTRGRPHDQLTLESMPSKWRRRTIVVCPRNEAMAILEQFQDIEGFLHFNVTNLAQKRVRIFQDAHHNKINRILLLDDDLKFRVRERTPGEMFGWDKAPKNPSSDWAIYRDFAKVVTPEPTDKRLDTMFVQLDKMLGQFAHGGLAMQFMQQSNISEFKTGGRYLHALAYHVPTVIKHCKLGRILLSSDYDYALQLMEAGYTSSVYCWATEEDPNGFNAPGGVSNYRNAEVIRKCSEHLAKLHPGIVKLVPYKAGSKYEHLGVRTQASWKKALQMGLAKRGVEYGTLTGKKPK